MAYQCQDCSYKSRSFPGGRCPGCGSARILNLAKKEEEQPAARKPYRLALCIALWLMLLYEIYKAVAH